MVVESFAASACGSVCFEANNALTLRWIFHSSAGWEIIENRSFGNARWFLKDRRSSYQLQNVPHRLRTLFGFLREKSLDQIIELGRDVLIRDKSRRRSCREMLAEKIVGRVAGIRCFAGAQFEQHAAH